jgi:putative transposase
MPNHVHGVVQIYGESGVSLGEIMRTFKAVSTRAIRQTEIPDFAWQTNYHEHIIRNEHELERIRNYIVSNPVMWKDDPENPWQGSRGMNADGNAEAGWAR